MIDLVDVLMLSVLGGAAWRFRGVLGWPFTLVFAAIQWFMLEPALGRWAVAYAAWVFFGELWGWKPKLIWDSRDWTGAALRGFLIGGLGAVFVPLSVWIKFRVGEPSQPADPRFFWMPWSRSPKFLLDWRGAWHEVYFGALFTLAVGLLSL